MSHGRAEEDRYSCHIKIDYPIPIVDDRQARQEYLELGKFNVDSIHDQAYLNPHPTELLLRNHV